VEGAGKEIVEDMTEKAQFMITGVSLKSNEIIMFDSLGGQYSEQENRITGKSTERGSIESS
jgi:hypothetical protein